MAIRNVAIDDTGETDGSGVTNYRHELLIVPEGKQYAVTTVMVCNKYDPSSTNPEDETSVFDMYIVPDGSTIAPDTTVVVRKLPIPAGETFTFDSEKIILGEYDRIVIDGEAPGNLVATVSYLEV